MQTHTFRGRRYKIGVNPAPDGDCSQYKAERELNIYADMKTRNGLVTALHESLHACHWSATEEMVDETSKDIGRFLWALGYRIENGRK